MDAFYMHHVPRTLCATNSWRHLGNPYTKLLVAYHVRGTPPVNT
jgi:hypothetical protein